MSNISEILIIVGMITAVTNIVVQVLKQVTWDKIPTNIVVLAIAQALTLCSGFAYAEIHGITVAWYMVVAAVVVGFAVAYAAMFGYDKLMEVIQEVKKNAESD